MEDRDFANLILSIEYPARSDSGARALQLETTVRIADTASTDLIDRLKSANVLRRCRAVLPQRHGALPFFSAQADRVARRPSKTYVPLARTMPCSLTHRLPPQPAERTIGADHCRPTLHCPYRPTQHVFDVLLPTAAG